MYIVFWSKQYNMEINSVKFSCTEVNLYLLLQMSKSTLKSWHILDFFFKPDSSRISGNMWKKKHK